MHRRVGKKWVEAAAIALVVACAGGMGMGGEPRQTHVEPGITVLLRDSASLLAGKRVGLLTNQSGVDEHGTSDIDLLYRASKALNGSVPAPKLVALLSPEHGIRGTEDRTNLANGRDVRTGLPIYSLYGGTVLAPPDSLLDRLDVLIVDLQDLGARPWTYVASLVYAMRAAAQHHVMVIVPDRPNPITGMHVEGPVIDSTIAFAGTGSAARPAHPTALYPIPMRHGLTMGELARFYNNILGLHADLHVIPMSGWRRAEWFDQTGLPWIKPSPNMPSLASATLYPGIVWLESTNLSVGRGTGEAFQLVGAPWLNAKRVVELLSDRNIAGVKFEVDRFTPQHPTDDRYGGKTVNGFKIEITDRDHLQTSRLGAAIIWAVARVNGDSLHIRSESFDLLFGVPSARVALLSGADPDSLIDASLPATVRFEEESRKYQLYR
ncbi:MAG TPA: DUF1343 domain-containing protein [Gemmatimonadaceae bacterium]|nr:DUF1343 domain-containing protein [Gemmatimonadaceae bacterium]